jgi:hypothetical protein
MAKKLALNIEDLRIEQFQVEAAAAAARGTVRGLESYTCYCGSNGYYTDPCRFCLPAPITYTCDC